MRATRPHWLRWFTSALYLAALMVGRGQDLESGAPPAGSGWITPSADGHDTQSLQEGIDRGRLDLGPGRFRIQRSLEAPPGGLFIQGAGMDRTVIDASQADDFLYAEGSGVLVANGELIPLPSLIQPATAGHLTIEFVSPPDLGVDDVMVLFDRRESSFSSHRPYYRNGEHLRAAAVKGSQVRVHRMLSESYDPQHTDAYLLRGTPVTLRDLTVVGRPNETAPRSVISLDLATPVRLENVRVSGGTYSGIRLSRCHDFELRGVVAFEDHLASHRTDYGLVIGNSQRGRVSGGRFTAARHAIAMGGGDLPGSIPCRDIVVTGAVASVSQPGSFALDCHGNCVDITYRDMRVYGGASLGGQRTHLKDSRVECSAELTSGQVPIYFSEFSGLDHQLTGCDISSGSIDQQRGLFVDVGGNDVNTLNQHTRDGGTLLMRDNRFHYTGESTGAPAILIRNRGYNGAEALKVVAIENTLDSAAPIGMFLNVSTLGGAPFHEVRSRGNRGKASGLHLHRVRRALSENDAFESGNRAGLVATALSERLEIRQSQFRKQALPSSISGMTPEAPLAIHLQDNHWSLRPWTDDATVPQAVLAISGARFVRLRQESFGEFVASLESRPQHAEATVDLEQIEHLQLGPILDALRRPLRTRGELTIESIH